MTRESLREIQAQFTRTADVYARMRQTTDERTLEALVGLCEPDPSARALDVACGPGFLTLALARRCGEVRGFDATDAFLELARAEAERRGQSNVLFQQGDAEALPFEASAFDVVTCRAAFHHFPQPGRVLAEMARVAAPGGRILVADMLGSEDAVKARAHDHIERLCDPTHARALPESELDRLFVSCGLAVTRRIHSTLDYDLDEWLDHGAPDAATRREITRVMASGVEHDLADLAVRLEAGRLRFRHRTAVFVLVHDEGART